MLRTCLRQPLTRAASSEPRLVSGPDMYSQAQGLDTQRRYRFGGLPCPARLGRGEVHAYVLALSQKRYEPA